MTAFWIQVYNVPVGFRSERVCRDVGNHLGAYESYDPWNFDGSNKLFLRVRAQVNVRKPLKKHMKLRKVSGDWFLINFKNEKLPTFCFICGLIGHGKMFCKDQYEKKDKPRKFGLWLHAPNRSLSSRIENKWLQNQEGELVSAYDQLEKMMNGEGKKDNDEHDSQGDAMDIGEGVKNNVHEDTPMNGKE